MYKKFLYDFLKIFIFLEKNLECAFSDFSINRIMPSIQKMVRHALKIL